MKYRLWEAFKELCLLTCTLQACSWWQTHRRCSIRRAQRLFRPAASGWRRSTRCCRRRRSPETAASGASGWRRRRRAGSVDRRPRVKRNRRSFRLRQVQFILLHLLITQLHMNLMVLSFFNFLGQEQLGHRTSIIPAELYVLNPCEQVYILKLQLSILT